MTQNDKKELTLNSDDHGGVCGGVILLIFFANYLNNSNLVETL